MLPSWGTWGLGNNVSKDDANDVPNEVILVDRIDQRL